MAKPVSSLSLIVGAGLLAALAMLLSGKHSDLMDGSTDSGLEDLYVAISLLLASCLVGLAIGHATSEIPISETPRTTLGSPDYDITPIQAPAASGPVLVFLSKIIGNTTLGHLVARPLLNDNGPDQLRDLARQATAQGIPVISMPLCRVASESVTDAMAATATEAIQKGLPRKNVI